MILLHLNMSLVQGGDEMKVGDLVAFAVQSYMTGPWSDQKCGIIIEVTGDSLRVRFPRGTVYAHSEDFKLLSDAQEEQERE